MKDFLVYLITKLVSHPEEVNIEEQLEDNPVPSQETDQSSAQKHLILSLKVSSDDMGLVIGKNGKVISAIRTLLKLRNQITREYLSVALHLQDTAPTS